MCRGPSSRVVRWCKVANRVNRSVGLWFSGTSIVINGDGSVSIAFINPGRNVMLANNIGGTRAAEQMADEGYRVSLALDPSGGSHIVYTNEGAVELDYASRNSGIWSSETVFSKANGGSLAIDSSGTPKVSFTNNIPGVLMYATRGGTGARRAAPRLHERIQTNPGTGGARTRTIRETSVSLSNSTLPCLRMSHISREPARVRKINCDSSVETSVNAGAGCGVPGMRNLSIAGNTIKTAPVNFSVGAVLTYNRSLASTILCRAGRLQTDSVERLHR